MALWNIVFSCLGLAAVGYVAFRTFYSVHVSQGIWREVNGGSTNVGSSCNGVIYRKSGGNSLWAESVARTMVEIYCCQGLQMGLSLSMLGLSQSQSMRQLSPG